MPCIAITTGFGDDSILSNSGREVGLRCAAIPRQRLERRDIRAGDERASGAEQDDARHGRIAIGRVQGREQPFDDSRRERVDRWIVDKNNASGAAGVGADLRVCHGVTNSNVAAAGG